MSWLVNSLANSLKLDDDEDVDPTSSTSPPNNQTNPTRQMESSSSSSPPSDHPRGVKDDLSEFSKTLTRQLWGVASFLAPPPQIPDPHPDEAARMAGMRSDLSEIGGKFRTEISRLSSNKAVSGFTKMASSVLFAGGGLSVEDYARRGVVGVTEEVVSFARDVAMHPETWLDFPLPDDDVDQDFDLSDAQQEHALAVERLAPELAALRTELCLAYMSEGAFWKIYFVLVHPRLSRHDAEILSTPEIVKARAMLSHDLQSRVKARQHDSRGGNVTADSSDLSREEHLTVPVIDQSESVPVEISSVEAVSSVQPDFEIDKHPVASTEIPVVDKAVVEEVPTKQTVSGKPTPKNLDIVDSADLKDEDDADDWLKEEDAEAGSFKGASYPLGTDDDVSFSDLEEDDDVPTNDKKVGQTSSSTKESGDWIQLKTNSADSSKNYDTVSMHHASSNKVSSHKPENKESNDWLDIEDIDDA